jgi:hypothetical protein
VAREKVDSPELIGTTVVENGCDIPRIDDARLEIALAASQTSPAQDGLFLPRVAVLLFRTVTAAKPH